MDAKFRLKQKLRKNARQDSSLAPGLAHVVAEDPYKEHLKNYISETDVSAGYRLS